MVAGPSGSDARHRSVYDRGTMHNGDMVHRSYLLYGDSARATGYGELVQPDLINLDGDPVSILVMDELPAVGVQNSVRRMDLPG